MRKKAISKGLGKHGQFSWRSTEVSRLEGFSDAVFAFALTLLVVSLEVPKTFDDLLLAMRGFVAFSICFVTLVGIWYTHYSFFRRYGLVDNTTITLNAILLFVILFYVYPLKFLFSLLVNQFFGSLTTTLANGIIVPIIKQEQVHQLLIIYGLGYISVFLIFAVLYIHAYRSGAALKLTQIELHITKQAIQRNFIYMGIGILSVGLAFVLPVYPGLSGFAYFLISPCITLHYVIMEKRRKQLFQVH